MFGLRRRRKAPTTDADASGGPRATGGIDAAVERANPEALLRRLEWTVIKRLDGLLHGDYRTLFRGFGLDLADLREYQPNDDVRYIDWNVTARLQVPHVREFQEDREVAAWFLLDLSGSVNFGSSSIRKRNLSSELVGTLARLLTRYGNRVGALFYGTEVDALLPARAGRLHVLHLLSLMNRAPKVASGDGTDLNVLLTHALGFIKRRSVVFVVSDFISKPGWEKSLGQLARRHEVIAVRLFDPLEVAMPNLGQIVLQDAETGEQMFVDTHDKTFRARFAKAAEDREDLLRASFAAAGVDCLELATDARVDEALLRFTKLRKRRSQLATGTSATVVS
jgi:uncharacterized protein (DUF58 family)